MKIRVFLAGLLFALVPLSALAAEAQNSQAGQVVETLHAALLDAMKRSKELGYKGRVELLAPVIQSSFDFPNIARIVVGRYWAGLKADEQKTFIDTFSRLSVATYASRFNGYGGESFRTVGQETQPDGNVVVKTELVKADKTTVKLDYMLHPGEGGRWLILNVIAEGISDLSLKRAEYASIIKNEGFGALISKLNDKIAHYEQPSSG